MGRRHGRLTRPSRRPDRLTRLTGRRRRCRQVIGALAAGAVLAACTSATAGRGQLGRGAGSGPAPSLRPSSTVPSPPSAPAPRTSPTGPGGSSSTCPATYAAPDPNRPKIGLRFTVNAAHDTVQGTEDVDFTPDRSITELVFRLTANTIPTVREGNRIVVHSASADNGGRFTFSRANADPSTQGGLLHIPLQSPVAAGGHVHAHVAFTLTLGSESFDRFGRAGDFAFFGSAQPLLAWQRGYGWHTEGMIDFPAESATSEAADTSLTVTAPASDTVIMSGDPADPPKHGSTRTWTSTIAAARDVSVALGPFAVADTTVGSVKLRLGAPSTAIRDQLVPEFRRAITELSRRFGPFPFPSLSVARLPAAGGGIEYPSSILMLDGSRLVAVHETAHQWFYAMVGDSQALHPWLDEAFAQYSEQQVDGTTEGPDTLAAPGNVDASTESYGHNEQAYYFTTYDKGAAALAAARQAGGPARFDAALRCYVKANAWRIAVPDDLKRSLTGLPAAIAVLRRAGALT